MVMGRLFIPCCADASRSMQEAIENLREFANRRRAGSSSCMDRHEVHFKM